MQADLMFWTHFAMYELSYQDWAKIEHIYSE